MKRLLTVSMFIAILLPVLVMPGVSCTNPSPALSTPHPPLQAPVQASPVKQDAGNEKATQDTSSEDSTDQPVRKMEKDLFDRVNKVRTDKGLHPLTFDDTAYQAAMAHSLDMARRKYFAHKSPEGHSVTYRLGQLDFEFINTTWGENIAMNHNFPDPAGATLKGWIDSPGHYKNMVKKEYQYSAIAIVKTEEEKYYFTQVFWGKL